MSLPPPVNCAAELALLRRSLAELQGQPFKAAQAAPGLVTRLLVLLVHLEARVSWLETQVRTLAPGAAEGSHHG